MKPVQDILHRIRWDKNWAESKFTIGYYDRIDGKIVLVPFQALHFPQDDHFSFEIVDEAGEIHSVPYHRIKRIYQDGQLIWRREQ